MIPLLKCTNKTPLSPMRLTKIILIITLMALVASCASTPQKTAVQDEGCVVQAVQYMNAVRLDAALASVKKALELNPKSAGAYTVAGLIYNKNNQT